MGSTYHQKGSGRLYGLTPQDKADTYVDIHKKIKEYEEEKISEFSTLLLKQKKDGIPINTGNVDDDRFFNGLNLLLDYEVARRLVVGDKFHDLPVISYIHFIITNLGVGNHFENFVVGDVYGDYNDRKSTLFSGVFRASIAVKIIPNLKRAQNSMEIRRSLDYLHLSDEDSEDDKYGTGDEL